MKQLAFYKLQATGNDFILITNETGKFRTAALSRLAQQVCTRKLNIGADGLLVIEPSAEADFAMRIFNPDGSEAEMCGNGARCTILWAYHFMKAGRRRRRIRFMTQAGLIEGEVLKQATKKKHGAASAVVRVKLSDPGPVKENIPVMIFGRKVALNSVNTGVPHAIVFVQGLEDIAVQRLGREIRYHKKFAPAGTNVDFVQIQGSSAIALRTYERGVEDETLACGTGIVAAALVSGYKLSDRNGKQTFSVTTQQGEKLQVSFTRCGETVTEVWLEGITAAVYHGELSL